MHTRKRACVTHVVTAWRTWFRRNCGKKQTFQYMILMNGFTYSCSIVSWIKTYRTVSICCQLPLISFRLMRCGRAQSTSTKIKHHIDVLPFHRCPRSQLTRHTCHCLNGECYRKKEKNNRRLFVRACVCVCVHDEIQSRTVSLIYPDKRADIHFNPFSTCAAYHVPAASAHIAYSKTIRRERVLSWINTL